MLRRFYQSTMSNSNLENASNLNFQSRYQTKDDNPIWNKTSETNINVLDKVAKTEDSLQPPDKIETFGNNTYRIPGNSMREVHNISNPKTADVNPSITFSNKDLGGLKNTIGK